MKKIAITLSLLGLTSLVASNDMKSEITLTSGYNKFDSASAMDDALLVGIRATIYEQEINTYGLQIGYEGSTGINYINNIKQTDMHRIFTNLVIDGEEEYSIAPYLFLGGGYEFLSDEINGEPSQGFLNLGLGFKYFFTNNLKAMIETRAINKFDTRDLDFNINMGVGYAFGRKPSMVSEPIVAMGSQKSTSKHIITNPVINMKKAPMAQAPKAMDELTAMVNEIDANMPTQNYTGSTSYPYSNTSIAKTIPQQSGKYYIQMAALESTATQPLINTLTRNGYRNTIVHARGRTHLVLVGPYRTRAEALSAKNSLKSIKYDAFIYKMK